MCTGPGQSSIRSSSCSVSRRRLVRRTSFNSRGSRSGPPHTSLAAASIEGSSAPSLQYAPPRKALSTAIRCDQKCASPSSAHSSKRTCTTRSLPPVTLAGRRSMPRTTGSSAHSASGAASPGGGTGRNPSCSRSWPCSFDPGAALSSASFHSLGSTSSIRGHESDAASKSASMRSCLPRKEWVPLRSPKSTGPPDAAASVQARGCFERTTLRRSRSTCV